MQWRVRQGTPRLAVRGAVLGTSLLLFLLAPSALRGQEECPQDDEAVVEEAPPDSAPKPNLPARFFDALKREVRRYGNDSLAIVKAPLSWNKKQWELAAGSALIAGGLMLADKDIDRAVQRNRSNATNNIAKASAPLGAQYGFELSGTIWIAGTLLNHQNMRETGRDAVEAGVIAYVIDAGLLKHLFGRERPQESDGRTVFVPFSSHDSFPSGHTTEAFAVASVIAARSKSWPIPVIAYSLATLVALDRMNTRDHFASDVVAGAFLGTAIGHFIVHRHGEEEKGVLSKATLEIVPIRHGLAARIGW